MKKKLFLITLMITVTVSFVGCSYGNNASYSTDTTMHTEGMTGYPDGEIQRPYLFYNGILYQYKFECREASKDELTKLYPGYEFVGSINKISNKEMPDEEFEASRFSVGAEIYANDTTIIVFENGVIKEMENVNAP